MERLGASEGRSASGFTLTSFWILDGSFFREARLAEQLEQFAGGGVELLAAGSRKVKGQHSLQGVAEFLSSGGVFVMQPGGLDVPALGDLANGQPLLEA